MDKETTMVEFLAVGDIMDLFGLPADDFHMFTSADGESCSRGARFGRVNVWEQSASNDRPALHVHSHPTADEAAQCHAEWRAEMDATYRLRERLAALSPEQQQAISMVVNMTDVMPSTINAALDQIDARQPVAVPASARMVAGEPASRTGMYL